MTETKLIFFNAKKQQKAEERKENVNVNIKFTFTRPWLYAAIAFTIKKKEKIRHLYKKINFKTMYLALSLKDLGYCTLRIKIRGRDKVFSQTGHFKNLIRKTSGSNNRKANL
ncbi:MAG: hypothetical protein H0T62_00085 [Parachlamydiaceae bacterium]|nr:hypothetical protein [Parachlamydiaceae bacterium]